MADISLTSMITPSNQVTYCTRDGSPYRGDDSNMVQARPEHHVELLALGFTDATLAQVPAGDPLTFDPGWAIAV